MAYASYVCSFEIPPEITPGGQIHFGCYLCNGLLAGYQHDHPCCSCHHADADDAEHPGAVVAGLGQIVATGVDYGQRRMGIDRAVVLQHVDSVTVHGGRGSQQVVRQLLLGHIVEDISQTAVRFHVALCLGLGDDALSKAGIILNETGNVGQIDVTKLSGFLLGDDDLDILLQQRVAVVGTDFGNGICVVFQTLDDHLAGFAVGVNGDEMGSVCFGIHMLHHVVNALRLVQLRLDEVVVGIVVDDELNILEVTLAVGEQLGQIDAVGV